MCNRRKERILSFTHVTASALLFLRAGVGRLLEVRLLNERSQGVKFLEFLPLICAIREEAERLQCISPTATLVARGRCAVNL